MQACYLQQCKVKSALPAPLLQCSFARWPQLIQAEESQYKYTKSSLSSETLTLRCSLCGLKDVLQTGYGVAAANNQSKARASFQIGARLLYVNITC